MVKMGGFISDLYSSVCCCVRADTDTPVKPATPAITVIAASTTAEPSSPSSSVDLNSDFRLPPPPLPSAPILENCKPPPPSAPVLGRRELVRRSRRLDADPNNGYGSTWTRIDIDE